MLSEWRITMKRKLSKKIGIFLTVLTLLTASFPSNSFPDHQKEPEISLCDYKEDESPLPLSPLPPEND